jgi:predicted ATPase
MVARSDSELERILADLQMAEFIYEQPSLGDVEFTFKHALTQEVAYHSVLTERRRMLHERAGAAIEKLFTVRPEEHIDQLAHHYGRSANLTKRSNTCGVLANRQLRVLLSARLSRSLMGQRTRVASQAVTQQARHGRAVDKGRRAGGRDDAA